MESLRLMMGGAIKHATDTEKVTIHRSEQVKIVDENTLPDIRDHLTHKKLEKPTKYRYINLTSGKRGRVTGEEKEEGLIAAKDNIVRVVWDVTKDGTENNRAVEITISPNTFAGTFKNFMCAIS